MVTLLVFGTMLLLARGICNMLPSGGKYAVLAAIILIVVAPIIGLAMGAVVGLSGGAPSDAIAGGVRDSLIAIVAIPFAVWYFRRQRSAIVSE